jgi:hypothetical protein
MTRADLALLSDAHAVALTAIVAPVTRVIPLEAARELHRRADARGLPFAAACARFTAQLHMAHGDLALVASAGRVLLDAVVEAMADAPPDASRGDIHG